MEELNYENLKECPTCHCFYDTAERRHLILDSGVMMIDSSNKCTYDGPGIEGEQERRNRVKNPDLLLSLIELRRTALEEDIVLRPSAVVATKRLSLLDVLKDLPAVWVRDTPLDKEEVLVVRQVDVPNLAKAFLMTGGVNEKV